MLSTALNTCTNDVCVPFFQQAEKFAAWNAREVTELNPLAIAVYPFAQLAKLINKMILPLLSDALLNSNASEAIKFKAGHQVALRLAKMAESDEKADAVRALLAHFSDSVRYNVEGQIYNLQLEAEAEGLDNPVYGRDFLTANPGSPVVVTAIQQVLQA